MSGRETEVFPLVSVVEGYLKGLSSGTSSLTGTAALCFVDLYLGQCIRESLGGGQVNSGSSVHSVGRATVVSHPLVDIKVPPPSVYPSPQPLRPSWPSLQAAFSHAVVFWPGA